VNIGDRLLEIEAGFAGKIGLAAKHLGSGRTILWHADAKRPTASVIKLPVLVHALMLAHDGRISLDDRVTLDEADKKPGSGSKEPNKIKVAKLTQAQVREIAKTKLSDLNTTSIESAMRTIAGTARSMGVDIEG